LEIAVTLRVVRSSQDSSYAEGSKEQPRYLDGYLTTGDTRMGFSSSDWSGGEVLNSERGDSNPNLCCSDSAVTPIRQLPPIIKGVQLFESSSHHPMAMNPKRKGSASQSQSALAKRARWEDELAAPPSETTPTAALISGVTSAHLHGGSYTVIGSNVQNTYHIHGPQPYASDILEILRNLPLPNFRDIQLDTLSKATDGTCVAVTSGKMFQFWIKKGRILWGIGIRTSCIPLNAPRYSQIELAGAGKTVLS
jgi:hypothetical protein